jgi:hypothetical protein
MEMINTDKSSRFIKQRKPNYKKYASRVDFLTSDTFKKNNQHGPTMVSKQAKMNSKIANSGIAMSRLKKQLVGMFTQAEDITKTKKSQTQRSRS